MNPVDWAASQWIQFRARKSGSFSLRDPALLALFGGGDTYAGIDVNEITAMNFSAVYASVRIIAETLGSLPKQVFERSRSGTISRVHSHPVTHLLGSEPNAEMTPMIWTEVGQGHVLTWGNGYSEIRFNGRGEPKSIWPRHPSRVTPQRNLETREIEYKVWDDKGRSRALDRSQMLHVPGFGFDGLLGLSPIRLMADSIGLGMAAEKYGAKFFKNASRPSGLIEVDGLLDDSAYERLKKDFERDQSGTDNVGRTAILEQKAKWKQISIPPNEAQFLETRKFQLTEIARWFRIPPHMLADLERATNNNIEQQSLDFEKFTIRPWLVRWEQEFNRKLFSKREQGRFFIKHNVEGLLRADIKTRFAAYQSGILTGWMNADEVREKEDMNPMPDGQGQIFLVPQNMEQAKVVIQLGEEKVVDAKAKNKDNERQQKIKAAHRELLVDVAKRLLSREAHNALRAAKKPDQFLRWLDDFYEKHETLSREALTPCVQAAMTALRSEADPTVVESNLVPIVDRSMIERSKFDLLRAAEVSKDQLEESVRFVCESWTGRAEEIADEILNGDQTDDQTED